MQTRLTSALDAGAVTLPDGPLLALRPPGDLDLSALPLDRTHALQPLRPDHDALAAGGMAVGPEQPAGPFSGAIVFADRARAVTLDLLARACAALPEGAPVLVDGAKADGIDAVVRLCRDAFEVGEVFAKAHGKVFAFSARPAPDGWRAGDRTLPDGSVTRPGTFSADGVDPGSAALAAHLSGLSGRVCDLGAGWGVLSRAVLASTAVKECALVEADRDALDCARRNVTDPRATFHWADARTFAGDPFDVVATNPPFHAGRRADPTLGRAFLAAAARLLTPRGRLLLVANRHLPYEATLAEAFREVVVVADAAGYKVVEARHPRRSRR